MEVAPAYRADVDGLRALAVVPVLFFHAGVAGFSGGFIGVDVFFVISGFVIALSIKRDLDAGSFSLASFYERRIRRILPAISVVALCVAAVSVWLAPPYLFQPFARSLSFAAMFASNIYFWKDIGYFNSDAPFRPLLHTWSLGVEEQYYLVAPIFFYLIFRFFRARWALAIAPALAGSFALGVYAVSTAHLNAAFFSLPTRVWELLLGALLALSPFSAPRSRAIGESATLAGLALIAAPIFLYNEATAFPGLAAAPPCLGAGLLIWAGAGGHRPAISRVLAWRPFVWVGLISYSLYLVHWPLIVMTKFVLLRRLSALETWAIVAASLLLAWALYHFVERPLRRAPAPRGAVFGLGAAALAGVALTGLWLGPWANARLYEGRPGAEHRLDWDAIDASFGGARCFLHSGADPDLWGGDACALTQGAGGDILLWGDSFAAHYAPGLKANAEAIAGRVLQYTMQGCPPLLGRESPLNATCAEFTRRAPEVIAQRRIRRVILSASWFEYGSRAEEGLEETLAALRGLGVETTIIGQSPFFYADPFLFVSRGQNASASNVSMPSEVLAREINQRLGRRAEAANAAFVDPIEFMCGAGECPVRADGRDLYLDYGHLSADGAALTVRTYFPYVRREGR